jgi:hypothetical protein
MGWQECLQWVEMLSWVITGLAVTVLVLMIILFGVMVRDALRYMPGIHQELVNIRKLLTK